MSIPMELMSIRFPNSSLLHRAHFRPPVTLCAQRSLSFQHLPSPRHFNAPKFAPSLVSCTGLRFGFSSDIMRNRSFVAFAASHEDSEQSGIEVEKEKSVLDGDDDTSQEPWKQIFASVKEQVSKMQSVSPEAYNVNSQKAMTILKDTSEQLRIQAEKEKSVLDGDDDTSQEPWKQIFASVKEQVSKMQSVSSEAYNVNSQKAMTISKDTSEQLRIQAEKAKEELGTKAKEVGEEGREYILKAAEESPSDVKEIVEAFASTEDLKDVSRTQDFHVGIPYGLLLLVGGFLSFMISGSIPTIRFGVILGGALFALSLASLKSQKKGESSTKFFKGQMAIVAIIFLRELKLLLSQRSMFVGFLTTLTSGGVLAFYVYKMVGNREKGPNLGEDGGEDECDIAQITLELLFQIRDQLQYLGIESTEIQDSHNIM